jgi:dephospho-CoA kinase
MGKSTVVDMLRTLHIPAHDSDATVHLLLKTDMEVIEKVAEHFPICIKENQVDRKILGDIIFDDDEARQWLKDLLYPRIANSRAEFLKDAQAKDAQLVVLDIPLLFEEGFDEMCDYVMCVTCSRNEQVWRVMLKPHMTEERFRRIEALQLSDEEKKKRSDYVLSTDGAFEETERDLLDILSSIKDKEQNKTHA